MKVNSLRSNVKDIEINISVTKEDLAELMLNSQMQIIEYGNIIHFTVENDDRTPEEVLDGVRKLKGVE